MARSGRGAFLLTLGMVALPAVAQNGEIPGPPAFSSRTGSAGQAAGQAPARNDLTTGAVPAQAGLPAPASRGADSWQNPPARSGALTLEQVLVLARNGNPALLAARRNLEGTRAQEIQAGVHVNPNLALVGQEVSLPASNPASPYVYDVQVSRLFERGEKRRWRLDGARATTAQTEAVLRDQERSTEYAVKQAFTSMLVAKASRVLAESNLQDFQRSVTINHERYLAGDLGRLDYERLDLQLAQFESDVSAASITVHQAGDQLQTLMGFSSPKVDFDITGSVVPPALAFDLAGLDTKALDARPDYQAALATVQAAEANVKLAYANGTTDPTVEGEYERAATYNSAGFNLSIPLRLFDRNQGNKKTSEFAAQGSRFAVVATKNQVLSDVDQAWAGYTESRALAARYNGHYLDEAADVLSIAQFAYEHGGLALIDYLDALRASRQTTADALQAYAATWLAIHQLSNATAAEVLP